MSTQITVPFHGHTLFVVEHDNQPYTPMKPIAEGMGVSWQPQHRKLTANESRWGIIEMMIPSAGGEQAMTCMPLRKLPGWLMTIYPNKVKPESRDAIIRFQNECDDVLWDYWTKEKAVYPQYALKDIRTKKAVAGGLTLEQQDAIKALVRSRIETLPKDRQGGAAITCWSSLKSKFGCTYKSIPPDLFGEALSLIARLDLHRSEPLPAPFAQHQAIVEQMAAKLPDLQPGDTTRWIVHVDPYERRVNMRALTVDDQIMKASELDALLQPLIRFHAAREIGTYARRGKLIA